MADSPTIPSPAVAFSEYDPYQRRNNDNFLARFNGGTLRSIVNRDKTCITLPAEQSHFGYLGAGKIDAVCNGVELRIPENCYFSLPGEADLYSVGPTRGVILSADEYHSYLMLGHLEQEGRLRYIDGCTDSLLIPPIKLGDPCLNLLYFPPNTDQTMHTHPSDRIGMILSGEGVCVSDSHGALVQTVLYPGMLFCIHQGGLHKFQTGTKPMRVLAYHPDSDFGPTDEVHPMINRTMVGGISASKLPQLHTVEPMVAAEIVK